MPRPYSKELREQIVRTVRAGISRRTTARLFDVSVGFVVKLMQRWNRDATLAPKRMPAYALAAHAGLVRAVVAAQPAITIDELQQRLAVEGIRVGRASVGRFLIAAGLTRRKRRPVQPILQARTLPPREQPSGLTGPF